ncbi:hypothetical protein HMPREF9624_01672 [Oribacterium asaccharolyticum ACB7]|uniref:Uncharacterized protein n=1 Tax=Oribacterium asaccharolyticum ACB7 TaxID=796944 RepID=G9WRF6_9FIRM|nr:hypothetical protein [Oribacterium asaccharolyticum]EHL14343.1 hypothetical protein HMPREF9624_01672 [Oribacterium asaccharolyticum ACB7]
MRVTARTYYQDYAKSVNDLHTKLNKSMEQVGNGRKFNEAKEDPIAYYAGKRIENQHNDAEAKKTVIDDVKNRLYQQEKGALSIQDDMRTVNTKVVNLKNDTTNANASTVETFESEFTQRLHSVVNTLNSQYDNFYVYGGNDMTTVPFSLKEDLDGAPPSVTLTYSHKFPGDEKATELNIKYSYDGTNYKNEFSGKASDGTALGEGDTLKLILSAMREQGKMSTGYGSLRDRSTLLDTYTGGLNMITGLSSDTLKGLSDTDAINRIKGASNGGPVVAEEDSLMNSPVALLSKSVLTTHNYVKALKTNTNVSTAKERFHKDLSDFINQNDDSESRVSDTYRVLGIKYAALEATQSKLDITMDTLQAEYSSKLAIDPYDAVVKMYSYQYSYNAAMKVGANIMQSSLFDFVGR